MIPSPKSFSQILIEETVTFGKRTEVKYDDDKRYCIVKDCYHYTGKYRDAAHIICNLRYKVPKDTPVVFHNRSNSHYYFIKILS